MNTNALFKSFNSNSGRNDFEMGLIAKENHHNDYFHSKVQIKTKEAEDDSFKIYELMYFVTDKDIFRKK